MSCNAKKLGTPKAVRNLMIWSCLALFSQLSVLAVQNVELTWLPSTNANVAGYLIYSGTESRAYTKVMPVGNVTNIIVTGLAEGTTNFFAAKAFDTLTNESSFSEETSFAVPAVVLPPDTNSIPATNPPPATEPPITNTPPVVTNVPPVIEPVVTNTPPVVTNTPPVVTNTPPVVTNTPPVVTNTPPVVTNTPPVITNTPPVVTNTPPVTILNQAPTLNALSNISMIKNSSTVTVNLAGITSGSTNENQTLGITASSGNTALISKVTVNYSSPNRTGTLTFKPVANAIGTALITVKVNDGGQSNNLVTRTFNVTVTVPPPKISASVLAALPKISRQLTNAATLAGKTVSLSVGVIGRAPFNYQWKCNGTNVPGANGITLSLKNVKASQSGNYSVLVSNSLGSTNSLPATVMVYATPAADLTNTSQSHGRFGFNVAGIPGYKYVVQVSSDMQHWSSVRTNTSPFTFMDTNCISFTQRYYRSYYLP
jgi:hypothetical protein